MSDNFLTIDGGTLRAEWVLVRHGESEFNAGLSIDPDCSLTPCGLLQARQLAGRLAGEIVSGGVVGIVSPYRRTLETAAAITQVTGLAFEIDEGVREWGKAAVVRGRHFAEESIDAVVERLREFIHRWRGRKLLVVSHATPIALLTQMVAGEPLTTTGRFWTEVENCCLRRVAGGSGAALERAKRPSDRPGPGARPIVGGAASSECL